MSGELPIDPILPESFPLSDESRPVIARELVIAGIADMIRADERLASVQRMNAILYRVAGSPAEGTYDGGEEFAAAVDLARKSIGEALHEARVYLDAQIPYLRSIEDTGEEWRRRSDERLDRHLGGEFDEDPDPLA